MMWADGQHKERAAWTCSQDQQDPVLNPAFITHLAR